MSAQANLEPHGDSLPPMIIVGIGASADGLEALRQLVANLPTDQRLVYILAQHHDPKHNSMLGPILSRETLELAIHEIEHEQIVEGSHFYIVPPGMDAYYANGQLHLEKATGIGSTSSIDRLFVSLAENHGRHSIGILLSGTGMDGVHGIRAIKAEGGITMAQLESTARFDSMPHATINTGHVDLVLPPEEIALQIKELVEQPDSPFRLTSRPEPSEDEIQEILWLLLDKTGSDFREYKRNTLIRRIERRMALHKRKTLEEYRDFLRQRPEKLYELHNDILISVTSFFRDPNSFHALHQVLEEVVSNKDKHIRIWVAGCATGEEAYSIAILLAEYLGNRISRYNVQIFGTDLCDNALTIAHQARYPKASITGIDARILDKYFIQQGTEYQLCQSIRNMVLFAHHNLVYDPPFSHLNMISCRNVLIYFNQNLQRAVLESFHYGLKEGGILFLGNSETVGGNEHLYINVERKACIYRRRSGIRSRPAYLLQARPKPAIHSGYDTETHDESRLKIQAIFDKLLVNIYQPVAILLDDRLEIVYVRGRIDPYLSFTESHSAQGILDLIKPELRQELQGLLYKSSRTKLNISSRRINFRLDDETAGVIMRAQHFSSNNDIEQAFTALIFESFPAEELPNTDQSIPSTTDTLRIRDLEEELRETRESLQTTIEELETSNEELQSTYEEAQSINEELYTSREELQTSNEELQSTNEELRTVNQELNVKSSELEAANLQLKASNDQLLHEIEERKWTEALLEIERAKLTTIFHSQPNWINICSLKGEILEANPAGVSIMEGFSQEQLVGRSMRDFVLPEYQHEIEKCVSTLNVTGESHTLEVKIRTFKGNIRWLEIRPVLIHLDNDELRIMSIIVDHTERMLAHQQLAARQQELAHIMRLNTLGEMASGIAHELNQPLAAISNYLRGCELRMQQDNCSPKDVSEVMHLVSLQVKRASEILRYARDFTRKDQEFEWQELDLNDVIDDTLRLLDTTEQFKQIQLVKQLHPAPLICKINKIQIEQVLINMILNALDAIREINPLGIGTLEVRTGRQNQDNIRILVIDNGCGLPEDYNKKIFSPFYTSKKSGMGMGLAISSSIIEAHGGKLAAENNNTQGATFSFTLPSKKE